MSLANEDGSVSSADIGYIRARGDDDGPGIRDFLKSNDVVELRNGKFVLGATIDTCGGGVGLASGKTVAIDNSTVKRADNALGPLFMNANPTLTTDSDISIIGVRDAVIDGNNTNNPHIVGGLVSWKSVDILPVGVKNLRVSGLRFKNPGYTGMLPQGCSNFLITNIVSDVTHLNNNETGLGFYGACSGTIDGYYGTSYDDGIVFCTHTTVGSLTAALTGLYPTGGTTLPGGIMSDITVNNMRGGWSSLGGSGNICRIFNGDGQVLRNITVNAENAFIANPSAPALYIGAANYVNTPATAVQCYGISMNITGWTGPCLQAEQAASHVSVRGDIHSGSSIFSLRKDIAFTISDIDIDLAYHNSTGGTPAVMFSDKASPTVANAVIRVHGDTMSTIVQNACHVSGLRVYWNVDTLASNIINSSVQETASFIDGQYGAFSGTALLPVQTQMKFGPNMPQLTSADTSPLPTSGSFAYCDATKVLDGGAAAIARYWADGAAWHRFN